MPALRTFSLLGILAVAAALPSVPVRAASTERVNVNSNEAQANRPSEGASVSADGRFVAFASGATNLVPGDNGRGHVFVRDRLTGRTERVSIGAAGEQGNSGSGDPSISADGRYVAFASHASNFVAGTVNGADVFVRDRAAGTIELINASATGDPADRGSSSPSISADGRYVAFASAASNLIAGDPNPGHRHNAYVKDRLTGNVERASFMSKGALVPGVNYVRISGDGRFVVFQTYDALVPGDTNGKDDIFIRDRVALTTTRVSVGKGGVQANSWSLYPAISGDGRFVAFASAATNLVAGDTNDSWDVFVRDRQTGTTERVSIDSFERQAGVGPGTVPLISADGRFVIFDSQNSDLIPDDSNNVTDVFARDRLAGTTEKVSVTNEGAAANGFFDGSRSRSVSSDGRFVAFVSESWNLVPGDTNGREDIFLRDQGPIPPPPRNDLLADFGAFGLSQRLNNTGGWVTIHNSSPIAIAAGDLDGGLKDEAIASFPGVGLLARYNNSVPWVKLHNSAPTQLVAGDLDGNGKSEVIASFGSGLFARCNNADPWVKLQTLPAQSLTVGDLDGSGKDELIVDRGADGLWALYDNTTWKRLHPSSPLHVAAGDLDGSGRDEVVADFPSGLWARYNDAGPWWKLRDVPSEGLAVGELNGGNKQELIADFGSGGLWARYSDITWVKRDARNPTALAVAYLDQNGKGELIADFGTGLWARYNDTGAFRKLSPRHAQALTAGGFD